jgi:hypothetical protein
MRLAAEAVMRHGLLWKPEQTMSKTVFSRSKTTVWDAGLKVEAHGSEGSSVRTDFPLVFVFCSSAPLFQRSS